MEDVGIFEAKTKFPGLCDQVVRSGSPVLVSRRGKPLVVVSPAPGRASTSGGILDHWREWGATHPETAESDFPEVWTIRQDKTDSPFED
jgi:prevent-host-death family protein